MWIIQKKNFDNNKYVYALGFLDNENTFKTEYLFIYRKGHAYFDNIKKNPNNYLQSIEQNLKFGPCPLTGKNYEEIGIVIGLNQSNKNSIEPLEININNFTKIILKSAYIVKKGIINKFNEIYSTNEVIIFFK